MVAIQQIMVHFLIGFLTSTIALPTDLLSNQSNENITCSFEKDFCQWEREETNFFNWALIRADVNPDLPVKDHTGSQDGQFMVTMSQEGGSNIIKAFTGTSFEISCLGFWMYYNKIIDGDSFSYLFNDEINGTTYVLEELINGEFTTSITWQYVIREFTNMTGWLILNATFNELSKGIIAIDDIFYYPMNCNQSLEMINISKQVENVGVSVTDFENAPSKSSAINDEESAKDYFSKTSEGKVARRVTSSIDFVTYSESDSIKQSTIINSDNEIDTTILSDSLSSEKQVEPENSKIESSSLSFSNDNTPRPDLQSSSSHTKEQKSFESASTGTSVTPGHGGTETKKISESKDKENKHKDENSVSIPTWIVGTVIVSVVVVLSVTVAALCKNHASKHELAMGYSNPNFVRDENFGRNSHYEEMEEIAYVRQPSSSVRSKGKYAKLHNEND